MNIDIVVGFPDESGQDSTAESVGSALGLQDCAEY